MKNFLFLIIGMTFSVHLVSSQELKVPADLKKLAEQSLKTFPKVSEMTDWVSLNSVKIDLGKSAYLPSAMGDLSYRRQYPTPYIPFNSSDGTTSKFNILPANNYNAAITVAQPLFDLRISPQINKAKGEFEVSKDNLENFKINLAYQVAQTYFSIIFLNKSLLVQQDHINLLRATLDQLKVKIKNGDALNYDLVSTEVKLTNVQNIYIELKAQLENQYNMLNMLTSNTGKGYLVDTNLNSEAFTLPLDSLTTTVFRNNPDLRTATDKIKLADWDIKLADRSRLPIVNLLAGIGYKNGYAPTIEDNTFNYFAGVGITIPIFPASRPGLQRKIAELNQHASQSALESQKALINKDMLNALEEIHKNQKKLSSSDTLIHQAQLAQDLAAERYKYGVITNLDMITTVSNFKDAQLSQLQFEYNLLLSKIALCKLAGIRFW